MFLCLRLEIQRQSIYSLGSEFPTRTLTRRPYPVLGLHSAGRPVTVGSRRTKGRHTEVFSPVPPRGL